MDKVFDFAPNSHVAEEIPPEAPSALSMNGWEFTAKPAVPYRRKFRLNVSGIKWYLKKIPETDPVRMELDLEEDPEHNAGLLLQFYREHLTWKTFTYHHEYLGEITCRFAAPVSIPKAITNSNGLVPEFEITLVHHNPGY